MKTVNFEYDKNTSLTVIVNEGWWFSLENLVLMLKADESSFINATRKSHCQQFDGHLFCTFQECCRRLIRSNKSGSVKATDWFFQTVVPQLRLMETLEQYKPITDSLGLIELENQEILSHINKLEAEFSQKFAQLTSEFQKCLTSLHKADSPKSSPIDLAKLREQQQYNNQIVENFLRSLEDSTAESSPLIDPVDDDPFMDLVVNSNGNSNGGKR